MPKRNRRAEFSLAKIVAEAFTRQSWDKLAPDVREAAKRVAKILHLLGYEQHTISLAKFKSELAPAKVEP